MALPSKQPPRHVHFGAPKAIQAPGCCQNFSWNLRKHASNQLAMLICRPMGLENLLCCQRGQQEISYTGSSTHCCLTWHPELPQCGSSTFTRCFCHCLKQHHAWHGALVCSFHTCPSTAYETSPTTRPPQLTQIESACAIGHTIQWLHNVALCGLAAQHHRRHAASPFIVITSVVVGRA